MFVNTEHPLNPTKDSINRPIVFKKHMEDLLSLNKARIKQFTAIDESKYSELIKNIIDETECIWDLFKSRYPQKSDDLEINNQALIVCIKKCADNKSKYEESQRQFESDPVYAKELNLTRTDYTRIIKLANKADFYSQYLNHKENLENLNTLIYNRINKRAYKKNIRSNHLFKFNECLIQLEIKRDEFHKNNPTDTGNDVRTHYGAAVQLIEKLKEYASFYEDGIKTALEFKMDTIELININQKGILSEHDDWTEILLNILLAIATIGIGYVVGVLFTQRFNPIKIDTAVVRELDQTIEVLNQFNIPKA